MFPSHGGQPKRDADDTVVVPRCMEPITPAALRAIIGFDVHENTFDAFKRVFVHSDIAEALGTPSLERLEFIGDSVIGLLCAKFLYDKFPDRDEGFLTKARSKLVCTKSLASMSNALGLSRHVVMDAKAFETGYVNHPSVAEDLLEAMVGCIYENLGLLEAKRFFMAQITRAYGADDFSFLFDDNNYKDAITRYCQARGMPLPTYHTVPPPPEGSENGGPRFKCCIIVDGRQAGFGSANVKKAGEQLAACQALSALGLLSDRGFVRNELVGRKKA